MNVFKSFHPAALGTLLIALIMCGINLHMLKAESAASAPTSTADTNGAISPKDEADSLHFVIAVDRQILCRDYTARRKTEDVSPGVERNAPPCPSIALRDACEVIQGQGAEFSYALRSLSPLGPRNAPQTELEQKAMEFIASHPGQNFYGREVLGGRQYFTAVYADLPATASCIGCHAEATGTEIQAHKVGVPLGCVVVRVPLEF